MPRTPSRALTHGPCLAAVLAACTVASPAPPAAPEPCPLAAPDASTPEPPPPPACDWEAVGEGLSGGSVADVRYDPRRPGVAWAAAGSGIYRSADHGRTWTQAGAAPAGVRQFAFPPAEPPEVVLAASTGGLMRTGDGGETWSIVALGGLSLSTVSVHPKEPARLYAAAKGAGVLASADGGKSWGALSHDVPSMDYRVVVPDPEDPRRVVAAGDAYKPPGGAVHRTVAGNDWAVALGDAQNLYDLVQCPSEPATLFASLSDGVHRSRDFGETWEPFFPAARRGGVYVAPAQGSCETLYVVVTNEPGIGFYLTTDGGRHFVGPSTEGIPFQWKASRRLSVDPTNPLRALGPSHAGILLTEDGARTFAVPGGVRGIGGALAGGAGGDLWMSTWGSGSWRKADGGASGAWAVVPGSGDFNFGIAPDPVSPGRALLLGWPAPALFDGAKATPLAALHNVLGAAFQPGADVVLGASQLDGVVRSTDRGATWTASNAGLPEPWKTRAGMFRWAYDAVFSADAPSRVLLGTEANGLFLSTDAGLSWARTFPAVAAESVSLLAYARGAGFVVATQRGPFLSSDGEQWERLEGLPVDAVGAIAADGAGRIYVTTAKGLFRGARQGGATTWEPFDGTCAPRGIGRVLVTGGRLYASAAEGVFSRPL